MASIPSKVSNLVAQKYQRGVNTFSRVVKAAPERKIETEIGDTKEIDFKPQVKTRWFNNEYNVSVRAEEDPLATVTTEGEKIVYTRSDGIKVVQYDKPDAGDEGGHELEWEIPSMPKFDGDFYRLKFTLRYKGNVKFYYQPALTQEEIDEGASRPENVEGSYAVYVDKSNHRLGSNNYATGKIEHIYRPKAIDAEGNEAWCTLFIPEEGQAETNIEGWVDVPRSFLEKVDYTKGPAVIDPTFGYQTNGASDLNICQLFFGAKTIRPKGSIFSASEAFTPTQISYYIKTLNNSAPTKAAIYDGSRNFIVETASSTTSGGDSWQDRSISGADSQLANNYWLIAIGDPDSFSSDPTFGPEIAYDSGDTNQGFLDTWSSYSFPATILASYSNDKYSIYATYTASGGEGGEVVFIPMLSLLGVG